MPGARCPRTARTGPADPRPAEEWVLTAARPFSASSADLRWETRLAPTFWRTRGPLRFQVGATLFKPVPQVARGDDRDLAVATQVINGRLLNASHAP